MVLRRSFQFSYRDCSLELAVAVVEGEVSLKKHLVVTEGNQQECGKGGRTTSSSAAVSEP